MAINLGTGVSKVVEDSGYSYDMVVFQKGKPILDTELNLVQQLQNGIDQKKLAYMASGWLTCYPFKTDIVGLINRFYTQDPVNPKPELALVNGMVVHVTSTNDLPATIADNLNMIDLGHAPVTSVVINGVFLEVWRALLDPDTSVNKPGAATQIDGLRGIYMFNSNLGWSCGENGLILGTTNGGVTWNVKNSGTKNRLNGINFLNSTKGYAVGDNGTIISTASSGESWVALTSPTVYNLNSIYVYDVSNAWAVGDSGTVLKSTNGVTWLIKTSGVTANLKKVYFYDQGTGWAVGSNGTILKTTDGGTQWLAQTSGVTVDLNSVYFYDLNYGFAVGNNGTVLRTSDGGLSWVNMSVNLAAPVDSTTGNPINLNDVTIYPSIDVQVEEEVSSQLRGVSKVFTVANKPITLGDGKGTPLTYPNPSAITVTVNGVNAVISSVNGVNGTVTLDQIPGVCDSVKVTYYYRKPISEVFSGQAWVVGDKGRVFYTKDVGQTWTDQTDGTYADRNLYGVYFLNQYKGWAVGGSALVIHTEDSGLTWSAQSSAVLSRQVQQVYYEGNVGTTTYLPDNSIHPDAAVQTTKRVQVQYRIRVEPSVDPDSNPEAGLSGGILGKGPNTSGTLFPYVNMGPTTGDYGLWRAQCSNTVDGYCWAIPMFFVSRRNSTAYSSDNANGEWSGAEPIRPDLLRADQIADSDILDVRRIVNIPSISEMLNKNFNLLLDNKLKTRLLRETTGGERYSTEMLQVDEIGTVPDGYHGDAISGALYADIISGISSQASISLKTSPSPLPYSASGLTDTLTSGGKYHPDWSYYKVVYASGPYQGKAAPGQFERISDTSIRFVLGATALTWATYTMTTAYIQPNLKSLKFIPSVPMLVTHYAPGPSTDKFYYQGVSDAVDSKILEEWSSGITGYNNHVIVYSAKDVSDTAQQGRASSVELHYFSRIGSVINIDACIYTSPNQIEVSISGNPYPGGSYNISHILRLHNVLSSFSYKIKDSYSSIYPGYISIVSAPGYEFVSDTLIEIIAPISSIANNSKNGAAVNFTPRIKGISRFMESEDLATTPTGSNHFSISTSTDRVIMGVSTSDTTGNPYQPVCWTDLAVSGITMQQIIGISGFGTNTLDMTTAQAISSPPVSTITVQCLLQRTTANTDYIGATIAYTHNPYQSVGVLPNSLTLEIQNWPESLFVSALGTGGGIEGQPFTNPLENIPVNDYLISTDGYFQNNDKLIFSNFSTDTGLVQLPVIIPGKTGDTITLSSSSSDALGRTFYSQCSRDMLFEAEGLQLSSFRKIFLPVIAKVTGSSDGKFLPGEYVMVIFSKTSTYDPENSTGMGISGSLTAVYRLINKPLERALS